MVIGSSSGSSITHSALNASPAFSKKARTSSRLHTSRTSGSSAAMTLPHLFLDRRQVLVGEGAAAGRRREVVIEAVVGRRAEGDLRARKQVLDRLGEDMREIVAHQLERVLLVARGDQGQIGIAPRTAG